MLIQNHMGITISYDSSMDSTESYSNNEEPDGLDKAIKVLDFLSNTAKQVEEGINDSLNNQYLKVLFM